jgi:hypothetical protein
MHNMPILKCISSLINYINCIISTALTVTCAGSLHGKHYINTYAYL